MYPKQIYRVSRQQWDCEAEIHGLIFVQLLMLTITVFCIFAPLLLFEVSAEGPEEQPIFCLCLPVPLVGVKLVLPFHSWPEDNFILHWFGRIDYKCSNFLSAPVTWTYNENQKHSSWFILHSNLLTSKTRDSCCRAVGKNYTNFTSCVSTLSWLL